MPFISLGFACLVRQSIDGYNGYRIETNFFDWLMTNFKTVLFIMQNLDNVSTFLTHDRFTDKGITDNNPTHRYIEHKEIYFLSLHDFPAEMDYWSYVNTFIEKYTRRAQRLKQIIQSCTEKINFIHFIPYEKDIPNIEETYVFIMTIKAINPNCNFCLNLCVPPELLKYQDQINTLRICNNVKIYYMVSNGETITMQRSDLNWREIYDSIEK